MMAKRIKHSEGIDRISSLPEPLLSHILSLLPTKYAVATSLLSTRWRFLWTSISNLDFDDEEAKTKTRYIYRKTSLPKSLNTKRKKFAQFVIRVLLLLNPPCIQNFQLKCHHQPSDPFYLDSWICAAIGRNVQQLNLELSQPMELPMSHFHGKTLAVLKMNGDIHFNIYASPSLCLPKLVTLHLSKTLFTIANNCSVSFPSLKDLLLDSVRYTNEESVQKLFGSCSSLENLIIKISAHPDNLISLIISIPSLISLTLDFWDVELNQLPEGNAFKLQIDTPALKYLHMKNNSLYWFSSRDLSSLIEARIQFSFHESTDMDGNSYSTNISRFIEGLFNAKFLSISGSELEAISSIPGYIAPVFCNLTRLEISRRRCGEWSVVLNSLLETMYSLEHLILNVNVEIYYCASHTSEAWWTEPLHVPLCLLHKLATISFTGKICGCSGEVKLIRYFLKNGKVLKKLTVESIGGSDAK